MLSIKSLLLSGQTFVLGQVDVFKKLEEVGRTFSKNLQSISAFGALIAAIICGIGFFLTRQAAEGSKSKLGQIIMGVGVVLLAPSAIIWLYTTFGGAAPTF
ncbi:hypothetical protein M8267_14000 [Enterococcus faecalis]|uniref:hypothetical protein n=1 Tax=Enterococcus TaxID=1350 RepID=UPI00032DBE34|nr:hypothetical protein [Enterococcus faecalis]EHE8433877.1 hypothetical protein [Enterococcus faecalis]EHU8830981.1 hypothetical protein [Enterococcus faecalis]EIB6784493.1 hypothetical protein [Enterococcus faecalis]EIP8133589.1 hypothetical protein [Enterococcus faecalis]EJZ8466735.1 hypothetical protein [Enterococcus faecalis]